MSPGAAQGLIEYLIVQSCRNELHVYLAPVHVDADIRHIDFNMLSSSIQAYALH